MKNIDKITIKHEGVNFEVEIKHKDIFDCPFYNNKIESCNMYKGCKKFDDGYCFMYELYKLGGK